MNRISAGAIAILFGLAGATAMAQDAMKSAPMAKEGMMKEPTMQDCKDHMAMQKKDGMKKDDASMKMDKTCADMMKKGGAMTKDAPTEPMKK